MEKNLASELAMKLNLFREADLEVKAWEEKLARVGPVVEKVVTRWNCGQALEYCGVDVDDLRRSLVEAVNRRLEAAKERRARIAEQIKNDILRMAMKEVLGDGLLSEVRQEEHQAL